jgi:hypothetical protein
MSNRHLARLLGSLAIAGLLFAPSARGELAAWDEANRPPGGKMVVPLNVCLVYRVEEASGCTVSAVSSSIGGLR